jgi:hypothetical protein
MVAGEPNDVRVEPAGNRWIVRIAEDGKVVRYSFETKAVAENYAESQRIRLGLPGMPPIEDQR